MISQFSMKITSSFIFASIFMIPKRLRTSVALMTLIAHISCHGAHSPMVVLQLKLNNLTLCLEEANFTLKGIIYSGEDPDESLSEDGKSLLVPGMRWFPKGDFLKLNISEVNFSRKHEVPEDLTLRNWASVTGEVFYLPGYSWV